ncbi:MAG TPA: PIG-L family deacetylase [Kutzneria sp.]|nr:PIG-L family deacetylase [Kutzneria sp.]
MSKEAIPLRILAISPHLDDAVLSAGARLHDLAADGHEVVVLTLFAGFPSPPYSPLAHELHELWGLGNDPVGARRREDEAALAQLGVTARHAGFLDAVYRPGRSGWQATDECADDALVRAKLAVAVRDALAPPPDLVLTAAGIGGHIDHVLTRDAVLAECRDAAVPVELWQDLPYAGTTSAVPRLAPGVRLAAGRPVVASEPAWRAKTAAVRCYTSQLGMLWPEHPDIARPLAAHARAAGGVGRPAELFWSAHWVAAASHS